VKFNYYFLFFLMLVGLAGSPELQAQTLTTLYNFSFDDFDGVSPQAGLVLSGTNLYGTTSGGDGTVFTVDTTGTNSAVLHIFSAPSGPAPATNSDGAQPEAGLILAGNTLYGTTYFGGLSGEGTVFAVGTNGMGFTNLYSFSGDDGAHPEAGLLVLGNTLYGTTSLGGKGNGTVFAINTNGTGFTNLYSFSGADGSIPQAGLISGGNTLYGTTSSGGTSGDGTVFAVNTNGMGFTNLYNFALEGFGGISPQAGLVLSGNTLYGTANSGGSNDVGTVFAISTNGTNFATLHTFTRLGPGSTNGDGALPAAGLVLSGNTLYGTAAAGGTNRSGTVFAVNIDGNGFTVLHYFRGGSDGDGPEAGLILSGNTFYGTTVSGGSSGEGTVFALTLPLQPAPAINGLILSGNNLVINAVGHGAGIYETLMSTNALLPFNQWTPVATNILSASGGFELTNPIDPNLPQCFYVLQAH
jgi:uncharacterized repeat protein (TIGR03803 family)